MRRRNIFANDKDKLTDLVRLRTKGAGVLELARRFGCDHTTISYNLRRFAPHLLRLSEEMRAGKPRVRRQRREGWWVAAIEREVEILARQQQTVAAVKLWKPLKYQRLIDDECVTVNPGRNYAQYAADGRRKRIVATKDRMQQLSAEYRARVLLRGKLVTKKDSWRMRAALNKTRVYAAG